MSAECKKIPQIIQGERKELTITLLNKTTGEAIDISGATEIQAVFPQGNSNYLIKKLEKVGVAEVTDITCLADVSQSLAGKYLRLNSPSSQYAFYFTVDGNGDAPSLSGVFLVEVAISENDDANTVAEALRTAINNQGDFTAARVGAVVTATNSNAGAVEAPSDVGTGFTIAVTTAGVTEVTDSVEIVGTGQIKAKLNPEETTSLEAGLRQTMHVSVDFADASTGRKIYKISDAYDVCQTDFSLD